MIEAWRITKAKYANQAFTGDASSAVGGRWNSPGTKVIYTASSISLAVLEIIAHLNRSDILNAYQLIQVTFEESIVRQLDKASLPPTWRDHPPPIEVQRIGDQWLATSTSVVLAVPSAIVPQETAYLLNPLHPEFRRLQIADPIPFPIDDRLIRPG